MRWPVFVKNLKFSSNMYAIIFSFNYNYVQQTYWGENEIAFTISEFTHTLCGQGLLWVLSTWAVILFFH